MPEPTPEQVDRLQQLTDLGKRESLEMLSWQPELCERIFRAAEHQQGTLYDPLEDDPQHGPAIAAALERATAEMRGEGNPQIWKRARQILREEHGLVWYSPAEMNPGKTFA
jgi:hypothetical protein